MYIYMYIYNIYSEQGSEVLNIFNHYISVARYTFSKPESKELIIYLFFNYKISIHSHLMYTLNRDLKNWIFLSFLFLKFR